MMPHPAAARSMRGPLIPAILALALAVAPSAAATAGAGSGQPAAEGASSPKPGSISGTVTVGPQLTARRIDFQLYADVKKQAPEKAAPTLQGEIRNVVVYLEPKSPRPVPRAASGVTRVMRQANETFEPHVLPILAGSTVEFPNFDPFFHNVFSLSMAGAFDLGHYPRGQSRTVTFDKPGIVKVFCHLHSDMSAVILVLETPYFAVPDENGAYAIDGVPPGEYTARAWHERAKPVSRTIRIEPGRGTEASFHVPIPESAAGE